MDRRLGEQLRSWRDAGLLSAEQAERIAEHEQARERGRRRSGATEAVGYIGAALAVSAVLLLISRMWDDLAVGGRLALTVLLTVAVVAAGQVLRNTGEAAIERLVSVLWLAGIAGTGWAAWVAADDLLALRRDDVSLTVALAVAVVAALLYAVRRRLLLQLATLAGCVGVTLVLLERPALPPDAEWWGLSLCALGLAWALLGAGGWLHPPAPAEAAGAALALVGTQVGSFGDVRVPMLVLGVLLAAALVGLAVARDGVHRLAVGALGLFVLVPQLVFELFGDAIGAPATLLVVGLLLVLLAVGLGRVRREVEPVAPTDEPVGPTDERGREQG